MDPSNTEHEGRIPAEFIALGKLVAARSGLPVWYAGTLADAIACGLEAMSASLYEAETIIYLLDNTAENNQ